MTWYNKLKWVAGILMVFLLVLATNLIDQQNFRKVNDSIEAMYADRLVAQNILYRLSTSIHEKELAYAELGTDEVKDRLSRHADAIAIEVDRYATTRLTERESLEFERLREELGTLSQREKGLIEGTVDRGSVVRSVHTVRESLDELSAIQLQEGRQQLLLGQRAVSSSDLFAKLEIGALIVLALAIQAIILYTPGMVRPSAES